MADRRVTPAASRERSARRGGQQWGGAWCRNRGGCTIFCTPCACAIILSDRADGSSTGVGRVHQRLAQAAGTQFGAQVRSIPAIASPVAAPAPRVWLSRFSRRRQRRCCRGHAPPSFLHAACPTSHTLQPWPKWRTVQRFCRPPAPWASACTIEWASWRQPPIATSCPPGWQVQQGLAAGLGGRRTAQCWHVLPARTLSRIPASASPPHIAAGSLCPLTGMPLSARWVSEADSLLIYRTTKTACLLGSVKGDGFVISRWVRCAR